MTLIRLQHETPEMYSNESRDFQLLLRVLDCLVDGIKFDIDTVTSIVNSHLCRTNILPLLQTKLGFFTKKTFSDDVLRYVLETFLLMVKNKGSLKSIQQAINVYLKIINANTKITVYSVDVDTVIFNTPVANHTIVIGLNSTVTDISILQEIFRYILPAGFGYYFYFYQDINVIEKYLIEDSATILYTTDNINAQTRRTNIFGESSSFDPEFMPERFPIPEANYLLGGADTVEVASTDNVSNRDVEVNIDNIISFQFRGFFDSIDEVENPVSDDICMVRDSNTEIFHEYVYRNDLWNMINFRGIYESTNIENLSNYDVVGFNVESIDYPHKVDYQMYLDGQWVENPYATYIFRKNKLPEVE